ncbi:WhiB family transcriptional regulator [Streptomyces sp. NPDC051896]|uniref:WhiB family transcriptional regulator n=1 Tax=Streptomyces sp. NPDC051896 TaxID=3155416 RepID=UPI00341E8C86
MVPTWKARAPGSRHRAVLPCEPEGPRPAPGRRSEVRGQTCPVRRPCVSRALATAHQYTIWCGMHEEELKRTVPKLPLPE